MPNIKQVLIPTDLSEHSKLGLRYGLELAASEQAKALVFYVADYRAALPVRAELEVQKYKTVREFVAEASGQVDRFLHENFSDLVRKLDVHVDAEIRPPATGAWELPPTPYKEPVFGARWLPQGTAPAK